VSEGALAQDRDEVVVVAESYLRVDEAAFFYPQPVQQFCLLEPFLQGDVLIVVERSRICQALFHLSIFRLLQVYFRIS